MGLQSVNWPREDKCQRRHAHGFLLYNMLKISDSQGCDIADYNYKNIILDGELIQSAYCCF